MWICKNCGQSIEDDSYKCWNCGTEDNGVKDPSFIEVRDEPTGGEIISSTDVILSTTSLVGLYKNLSIIGLVCSEIVIGTDIVSKLFAEVTNLVGGSSDSYQTYVEQARRQITQDIIDQVLKVKANAIMGIKYNYENIGNGLLMVSITGTAVTIASKNT